MSAEQKSVSDRGPDHLRGLATSAKEHDWPRVELEPDVILRLLDERDAAIRRAEDIIEAAADHLPDYGIDITDEVWLRCSCGWDQSEVRPRRKHRDPIKDALSWDEHLRAALRSQESQKPPDHLPREGCCDRRTVKIDGRWWHVVEQESQKPPETFTDEWFAAHGWSASEPPETEHRT